MMRLTIVGCSGSFPGPASAASCYLLTAHDGVRPWRILLDLGSGALGEVQKYLDLRTIDAIFLSHLHPDHYLDLCGLHVAVRWDPSGWDADRIRVWGPADTAHRLATAYGLEPDPGMHDEFDFRVWKPREPVRLGPFTITPYPVEHPLEEAYALRVEALEYLGKPGPGAAELIERRCVLSYSGDTDLCAGLIEASRDVDLFLCEAAFQEGRDDKIRGVHLTGRRAAQAAVEAGARRLLLTHLPVWTDATVVMAEAAQVYSGDLSVAVAGVHYTI